MTSARGENKSELILTVNRAFHAVNLAIFCYHSVSDLSVSARNMRRGRENHTLKSVFATFLVARNAKSWANIQSPLW
jgi:hypothetical protein